MKQDAVKRLVILTIFCQLFFPAISKAGNKECVILIHGLARTNVSMYILASFLKRHHYIVVNHNYPSTRGSVRTLANEYIPPMIKQCLQHDPKHIHFVTHSIGGIILQAYLQENTIAKLKNIVMLGPPNHGSPWVNMFYKKWFLEFVLGPAIDELSTRKESIFLGKGAYKIGIIAGNYNINPFGKMAFNEPNDGKVAVSSTKMQGMDDFLVLPVTHTFMMINGNVVKQVLYFIQNSHFMHQAA